ncbi:MAG: DUF3237 domain-containing protein [Rhodospirillales bacterium]|nr:DUF3237 domain-containing protein [Rhodospirillales bacterium]
MMTPDLRHVCDIEVEVGPIRDLGPTPHGRRRIIPILSGTVKGERLEGEVVPGGADWQYVRSDDVLELEARYSIKTKDGTEIVVVNRGLRRAAPEIMDRLSRGEAVDPALVYFRTVPMFQAPAGPHEWLNRSIFVATAARFPDKVHIRVFEVL